MSARHRSGTAATAAFMLVSMSTTAQAAITVLAGYTPETDVSQHARIDLDQQEFETLLGAGQFTEAGTLYAGGKHSTKSGAGGTTKRTLAGFSTAKKADGVTAKLAGEALFDLYAAYYGSPTYADDYVQSALVPGAAGVFTGATDTARAEGAKKGAAYMGTWMYVVHEFEDAVADCRAGTPNANDDAGVTAVDEAWAFYAGSLEGPAGTGTGNGVYALAEKRGDNFDTNKASGQAHVNSNLLVHVEAMRAYLKEGLCDDAARELTEAIVPQMSVPLMQGVLRYTLRTDAAAFTADAAALAKNKAEGWTFASALLPQIARCSRAVADKVTRNMHFKTGTMQDGYASVAASLQTVYACLGMTCADVGAYTESTLTPPSVPAGLAKCTDAAAVRTLTLAGYTTTTDVRQHARIDLDQQEFETLLGAGQFTEAGTLYAGGKHSTKSGAGGTTKRTLAGFSTAKKADGVTAKLAGEALFDLYAAYYGSPTYADDYVQSALVPGAAGVFTGATDTARAEGAKKGAAYMGTWMYVVHEFEDAVADCRAGTPNANDDAGVTAVDEAWAFYAGSLEGPAGTGKGKAAYALAVKRAGNFATTDAEGRARANSNLLVHVEAMRAYLKEGLCDDAARELTEAIVPQMSVPLMQGVLRYTLRTDAAAFTADAAALAKNKAEGWTFASALLPQIARCSRAVADKVTRNMHFKTGTMQDGYASVAASLQTVYACLGMTCADVGAYTESTLTPPSVPAGLAKCTDAAAVRTLTLAGYTTTTDVRQHARIDLDQQEFETLLGAGQFTEAGTLYAGGKHSTKSGAGGTTKRTLAGFSTAKKADGVTAKLAGEALFDLYAAYYGSPTYADDYVQSALVPGAAGVFTGATDTARAEGAKKGAAYMGTWMYVVHEFEDAVADCRAGTPNANDDAGVTAVDEAWAFYAGSLEGPAGTGKGKAAYALAVKRAGNFATTDAEGRARANSNLLVHVEAMRAYLKEGLCDDAARELTEAIVPQMSVPLMQGVLRYTLRTDAAAFTADAAALAKNKAEGWTFASALLPQIARCSRAVADKVTRNMHFKTGTMQDGYASVAASLQTVYACLGMTCADVGAYTESTLTPPSVPAGLAKCTDAAAVRTLTLAGYTTTTDVRQHARIDLDQQEFETLLGAGQFTEAGTLYAGGKHSTKSGAGGTTKRTLAGFSTAKKADGVTAKLAGEALFDLYAAYYGSPTYADDYVQSALVPGAAGVFTGATDTARAEGAKKGAAYMGTWMYVVHEFEDAVADCRAGTPNANDDAGVTAVDEAWAFYAGSLEGPAGTGKGKAAYALAVKRAGNFATTDAEGRARANSNLLVHVEAMRAYLKEGLCDDAARELTEAIVPQMSVPLMQGVLRYTLRTDAAAFTADAAALAKNKAEGWTFASALLPQIARCSRAVADKVTRNMHFKTGTMQDGYASVAASLQTVYACLGMTCADVGAYTESTLTPPSVPAGLAKCTDAAAVRTLTLAGYTTTTDVRQHARIDLDQQEFETLLGAGQFTEAGTLYAGGKHSTKSGAGGTTKRTLAGFSTAKKADGVTAKLAGEALFDLYAAYYGSPTYADDYVQSALVPGAAGVFTGATDTARAEGAKKGAAYMGTWMYVVHEFEDAVADCRAGTPNANDDAGVTAVDEAWAFYAGSLEGPAGTGKGKAAYALAVKRAGNFATTDAEGRARANSNLLVHVEAMRAYLKEGLCDDAARELTEAIVPQMSVPLMQGVLRYTLRTDAAAFTADAAALAKNKAEGWTFASALLPQIARCSRAVADKVTRNMHFKTGTMQDGYASVAASLQTVYACLGMTCADVGAYTESTLTPPSVPAGLAKCTDAAAVRTLTLAGYTTTTDVRQHARIDLDQQEFETLLGAGQFTEAGTLYAGGKHSTKSGAGGTTKRTLAGFSTAKKADGVTAKLAGEALFDLYAAYYGSPTYADDYVQSALVPGAAGVFTGATDTARAEGAKKGAAYMGTWMYVVHEFEDAVADCRAGTPNANDDAGVTAVDEAWAFYAGSLEGPAGTGKGKAAYALAVKRAGNFATTDAEGRARANSNLLVHVEAMRAYLKEGLCDDAARELTEAIVPQMSVPLMQGVLRYTLRTDAAAFTADAAALAKNKAEGWTFASALLPQIARCSRAVADKVTRNMHFKTGTMQDGYASVAASLQTVYACLGMTCADVGAYTESTLTPPSVPAGLAKCTDAAAVRTLTLAGYTTTTDVRQHARIDLDQQEFETLLGAGQFTEAGTLYAGGKHSTKSGAGGTTKRTLAGFSTAKKADGVTAKLAGEALFDLYAAYYGSPTYADDYVQSALVPGAAGVFTGATDTARAEGAKKGAAYMGTWMYVVHEFEDAVADCRAGTPNANDDAGVTAVDEAWAFYAGSLEGPAGTGKGKAAYALAVKRAGNFATTDAEGRARANSNLLVHVEAMRAYLKEGLCDDAARELTEAIVPQMSVPLMQGVLRYTLRTDAAAFTADAAALAKNKAEGWTFASALLPQIARCSRAVADKVTRNMHFKTGTMQDGYASVAASLQTVYACLGMTCADVGAYTESTLTPPSVPAGLAKCTDAAAVRTLTLAGYTTTTDVRQHARIDLDQQEFETLLGAGQFTEAGTLYAGGKHSTKSGAGGTTKRTLAGFSTAKKADGVTAKLAGEALFDLYAAYYGSPTYADDYVQSALVPGAAGVFTGATDTARAEGAKKGAAYMGTWMYVVHEFEDAVADCRAGTPNANDDAGVTAVDEAWAFYAGSLEGPAGTGKGKAAYALAVKRAGNFATTDAEGRARANSNLLVHVEAMRAYLKEGLCDDAARELTEAIVPQMSVPLMQGVLRYTLRTDAAAFTADAAALAKNKAEGWTFASALLPQIARCSRAVADKVTRNMHFKTGTMQDGYASVAASLQTVYACLGMTCADVGAYTESTLTPPSVPAGLAKCTDAAAVRTLTLAGYTTTTDVRQHARIDLDQQEFETLLGAGQFTEAGTLYAGGKHSTKSGAGGTTKRTLAGFSTAKKADGVTAKLAGEALFDLYAAYYGSPTYADDYVQSALVPGAAGVFTGATDTARAEGAKKGAAYMGTWMYVVHEFEDAVADCRAGTPNANDDAGVTAVDEAWAFYAGSLEGPAGTGKGKAAYALAVKRAGNFATTDAEGRARANSNLLVHVEAMRAYLKEGLCDDAARELTEAIVPQMSVPLMQGVLRYTLRTDAAAFTADAAALAKNKAEGWTFASALLPQIARCSRAVADKVTRNMHFKTGTMQDGYASVAASLQTVYACLGMTCADVGAYTESTLTPPSVPAGLAKCTDAAAVRTLTLAGYTTTTDVRQHARIDLDQQEFETLLGAGQFTEAGTLYAGGKHSTKSGAGGTTKRTLAGFSTAKKADGVTAKLAGEALFDLYAAYYGSPTYADDYVQSALVPGAAGVFTGATDTARAEGAKKGAAYMGTWMYVVHEFEDAVADCRAGTPNANDDAGVTAVDEAWAFYAGSLEGPAGTGKGKAAYALAVKRAGNFATTDAEGRARANSNLLVHVEAMRAYLKEGLCDDAARELTEAIVPQMSVPLMQGVLRYTLRTDAAAFTADAAALAKNKAEGWTFASALLPQIARCSRAVADKVTRNMHFKTGTMQDGYASVAASLQTVYACLGMTCADVGAYTESTLTPPSVPAGLAKCTDAAAVRTLTLAGYTTTTDVRQHARIDLDQQEFETLLGAGQFTEAGTLYAGGKHSTKSGAGGTTKRTLAGFSTAKKADGVTAKLAGEALFDLYAAYYGSPTYADDYVQSALVPGAAGVFTGATDTARAEGAKKGAAYMGTWMYVVHEFEDAVADCRAGTPNANDDAGVTAVDEAWAFYAGSLEGPAGTGKGKAAYALAVKRAGNFATTDAEGRARANSNLLVHVEAMRAYLKEGLCDDAARELTEAIVPQMSVPLMQGVLRYTLRTDAAAFTADAAALAKNKAEGWTFASALLPQIARCSRAVADKVTRNMHFKTGTMQDGYASVAASLQTVYACLGMTCADVGAYTESTLTPPSVPAGLAKCTDAAAVRTLTLAGYTTTTDVRQHARIDLDQQEFETLLGAGQFTEAGTLYAGGKHSTKSGAGGTTKRTLAGFSTAKKADGVTAKLAGEALFDLYAAYYGSPTYADDYVQSALVPGAAGVFTGATDTARAEGAKKGAAYMGTWMYVVHEFEDAVADCRAGTPNANDDAGVTAVDEAWAFYAGSLEGPAGTGKGKAAYALAVKRAGNFATTDAEGRARANSNLLVHVEAMRAYLKEGLCDDAARELTEAIVPQMSVPLMQGVLRYTLRTDAAAFTADAAALAKNKAEGWTFASALLPQIARCSRAVADKVTRNMHFKTGTMQDGYASVAASLQTVYACLGMTCADVGAYTESTLTPPSVPAGLAKCTDAAAVRTLTLAGYTTTTDVRQHARIDLDQQEFETLLGAGQFTEAGTLYAGGKHSTKSGAGGTTKRTLAGFSTAKKADGVTAKLAGEALFDLYAAYYGSPTYADDYVQSALVPGAAGVFTGATDTARAEGAKKGAAYMGTWMYVVHEFEDAVADCRAGTPNANDDAGVTAVDEAWAFYAGSLEGPAGTGKGKAAYALAVKRAGNFATTDAEGRARANSNLLVHVEAMRAYLKEGLCDDAARELTEAIVPQMSVPLMQGVLRYTLRTDAAAFTADAAALAKNKAEGWTFASALLPQIARCSRAVADKVTRNMHFKTGTMQDGYASVAASLQTVYACLGMTCADVGAYTESTLTPPSVPAGLAKCTDAAAVRTLTLAGYTTTTDVRQHARIDLDQQEFETLLGAGQFTEAGTLYAGGKHSTKSGAGGTTKRTLAGFSTAKKADGVTAKLAGEALFDLYAAYYGSPTYADDYVQSALVPGAAGVFTGATDTARAEGAKKGAAYMGTWMYVVHEFEDAVADCRAGTPNANDDAGVTAVDEAWAFYAGSLEGPAGTGKGKAAYALAVKRAGNFATTDAEGRARANSNLLVHVEAMRAYLKEGLCDDAARELTEAIVPQMSVPLMQGVLRYTLRTDAAAFTADAAALAKNKAEGWTFASALLPQIARCSRAVADKVTRNMHFKTGTMQDGYASVAASLQTVYACLGMTCADVGAYTESTLTPPSVPAGLAKCTDAAAVRTLTLAGYTTTTDVRQHARIDLDQQEFETLLGAGQFTEAGTLYAGGKHSTKSGAGGTTKRTLAGFSTAKKADGVTAKLAGEALFDLYAAYYGSPTYADDYVQSALVPGAAGVFTGATDTARAEGAKKGAAYMGTWMYVVHEFEDAVADCRAGTPNANDDAGVTAVDEAWAFYAGSLEGPAGTGKGKAAYALAVKRAGNFATTDAEGRARANSNLLVHVEAMRAYLKEGLCDDAARELTEAIVPQMSVPLMQGVLRYTLRTDAAAFTADAAALAKNKAEGWTFASALLPQIARCSRAVADKVTRNMHFKTGTMQDGYASVAASLQTVYACLGMTCADVGAYTESTLTPPSVPAGLAKCTDAAAVRTLTLAGYTTTTDVRQHARIDLDQQEFETLLGAGQFTEAGTLYAGGKHSTKSGAGGTTKRTLAGFSTAKKADGVTAKLAGEALFDLYAAYYGSPTYADDYVQSALVPGAAGVFTGATDTARAEGAKKGAAYMGTWMYVVHEFEDAVADCRAGTPNANDDAGVTAVDEAWAFYAGSLEGPAGTGKGKAAYALAVKRAGNFATTDAEGRARANSNLLVHVEAMRAYLKEGLCDDAARELTEAIVPQMSVPLMQGVLRYTLRTDAAAFTADAAALAKNKAEGWTFASALLPQIARCSRAVADKVTRNMHFKTGTMQDGYASVAASLQTVYACLGMTCADVGAYTESTLTPPSVPAGLAKCTDAAAVRTLTLAGYTTTTDVRQHARIDLDQQEFETLLGAGQFTEAGTLYAGGKHSTKSGAGGTTKRTLAGFSTAKKADGVTAKLAGEALFDLYAAYYGSPTYADDYVQSALVPGAAGVFTGATDTARAEGAKKGAAYMGTWMYVVHEFEDAVADCRAGTPNANDDAGVTAVDEAWAFYAGSLEGPAGTGKGKAAYALAVKRAGNFATTDAEGRARANSNLLVHVEAMRAYLKEGLCDDAARELTEAIVPQMSVPLMQGVLRYTLRTDAAAFTADAAALAKNKAEGWTFASALLPQIARCSRAVADKVTRNMHFKTGTMQDGYASVAASLQTVYACLGMTCADVGAYTESTLTPPSVPAGLAKCTDAAAVRTLTLAGYTTTTDVRQHARIDLDQQEFETLLGAGQFTEAGTLYAGGKHSTKSGAGGTTKRTLAGFSTAKKADGVTAKLAGEALFDLYAAYYGSPTYADDYVQSALVPGAAGVFTGATDTARAEGAKKGAAYMGTWMYVVHEFEDAVADCRAGTPNANDDAGVTAVDEAWAFYAGSLEGPAGTGKGKAAYALAVKRAGNFATTDAEGRARANSNLLVHVEAMRAYLKEGLCDDAARELTEAIVPQMSVPLMQGVLRYTLRTDAAAFTADAAALAKNKAEGWTFASALLPQIARCSRAVADKVTRNMHFKTGTMQDGYASVAASLQTVYACLGMTCADVGAYTESTLTPPSVPAGLAKCTDAAAVRTLTLAGYTTTTDVRQHARIDLDQQEFETLLGAGQFTEAGTLYAGGKHSTKSGAGGTTKRTLAGFSTAKKADGVTAKLAGEALFDLYAAYYGSPTYADDYVQSALVPGAAGVFTGATDTARAEGAKKGAAYMGTWMYVVHEFEDAVADCRAGTPNANDDAGVTAVDEAWAFYAGSLEGPAGTGKGKAAYALAVKRAGNFATTDAEGRARANSNLLVHVEAMRAYLKEGLCDDAARELTEAIVPQMSVPLMQGVLRYTLRTDAAAFTADAAALAKNKAEGWTFASALLPQIARCSRAVADKVTRNMHFKTGTMQDGYASVAASLQTVYACLGMTCADVGAYTESTLTPPSVPAGLAKCTDAAAVRTLTLAGYTTTTDVRQHARIDLDQQEFETLLGAGQFTEAGTLYAGGKHSTKSGAGGTTKRTLAGFSTAKKADGVTAKLAGEALFDLYAAYYGSPTYADDYVQSALVPGAAGVFTGATDTARAEGAKKGAAYMGTWMYVVHEFEDAVADCRAGTPNANDDAGVTAVDEAWAFYAGSLEGPAGTGKGKGLFALAEKRAAETGTVDAVGHARVNQLTLAYVQATRTFLRSQMCSHAAALLPKIVSQMSVPLVQGLLRYAFRADSKSRYGSASDAAELAKSAAEGWTFASAVLPQLDRCSFVVGQAVKKNMEFGIGLPMSDGFAVVFSHVFSVLDCLGMTCADLGTFTGAPECVDKATPTPPSVAGPVIAGLKTETDVTEHAKIDQDVKELATLVAAGDFAAAEKLYREGKYSDKAGGVKRTLRGFSVAKKTDGAPKLAGEQYFDLFSAYYKNATYADEFVLDALRGAGASAGLTAPARAELAKQAVSNLVVWMYTVHELEDAVQDCKAGDLLDNNGAKKAVEEAWAFYAGSLVGPAGNSSGGASGYTQATQHCKEFNTCTGAGGVAAANERILGLIVAMREDLNGGRCEAAKAAVPTIVRQMSVPLIQGLVKSLFLTREAGAARRAAGVLGGSATERAQGRAFAWAVLPLIDTCDSAVASAIESYVSLNSTPAVSFDVIMVRLESVFPCLQITCRDVGAFVHAGQNRPVCVDTPLAPSTAAPVVYVTTEGGNSLSGGQLAGVIVSITLAVVLCLIASAIFIRQYLQKREDRAQMHTVCETEPDSVAHAPQFTEGVTEDGLSVV